MHTVQHSTPSELTIASVASEALLSYLHRLEKFYESDGSILKERHEKEYELNTNRFTQADCEGLTHALEVTNELVTAEVRS